MTEETKQFISSCEICQAFQSANQLETLQPHELPSQQWEKIGDDLFEMNGKDYIVTIDYLMNFWEIDRLESTKVSPIVLKRKAHFARYGSPCVVVSDNGLQFTTENFKQFTCAFDFEHRTSCPYNSQNNVKAESAVKTAMSFLGKNKEENQFLSLLNHKRTWTRIHANGEETKLSTHK